MSDSTRKSASNAVLLILDSMVVARFEPRVEDGKTTLPRTQASSFIASVLHDETHELHEALKAGKIEQVNAHPTPIVPRMKMVF